MIINFSRASIFLVCKKKAFNYHHRRLGGSESFDLAMGSALHAGVAHGLATKEWDEALRIASQKFDEEAEPMVMEMLDEERYLIPHYHAIVDRMVQVYRENFDSVEIEVIQPECEFDFPLSNSSHNCIFKHWRDRNTGADVWRLPTAEEILSRAVTTPHPQLDPNCVCFAPHRLVGKTDAVVMWNTPSGRNLWLLEHKTSSREGDVFWDNFLLDLQPTTYLLGIWRTLGIRPRGFIINQIFKPSDSQVKAWNGKRKYGAPKDVADYIRYNRQAFLREDQDLLRAEEQYKELCDEWEWRVQNGQWPLTNVQGICQLFKRRCHYHSLCMSHDSPELLESYQLRTPDYVDEKYERIDNINNNKRPERDYDQR